MGCVEVSIYRVCGKEATKLMRREIKENRRRRKLKRLIQEVRILRRQLNAITSR